MERNNYPSQPDGTSMKSLLTELLRIKEILIQIKTLAGIPSSVEAQIDKLLLRMKTPQLQVVCTGLIKGGKSTFENSFVLNGLPALPTNVLPETMMIVRLENLRTRQTEPTWYKYIEGDTYPFIPQPYEEPPILLMGTDIASVVPSDESWSVQDNLSIARGCNEIRNYLSSSNKTARQTGNLSELVLRCPMEWSNGCQVPVVITDSPGANETSVNGLKEKVRELLTGADLIIYVLDVTQLGGTDECKLLMDIANCAQSILRNISTRGYFLLNKIDRANMKQTQKYVQYVQDFLKRSVMVDGKPLEVPTERILPISSEFAYLAKSFYRANRSIGNMIPDDKDRLLSILFGMDPPTVDEIMVDRSLIDELNRGVDRIYTQSKSEGVEKSISNFLIDNAFPSMISAFVGHFNQIIDELESCLNRRLITCRMNSDELRDRIKDIVAVLDTLQERKEAEELSKQIGDANQEAINEINIWLQRAGDIRFSNSSLNSEYPTQQAAIASAHLVAQQWYNPWLVELIKSKNEVESKIGVKHQQACKNAQAKFEGLTRRIADALVGVPCPSSEALSRSLSSLIRPKSSAASTNPINLPSFESAVLEQSKSVSYTENEAREEQEAFQATEWRTVYRSSSGRCGKTRSWTENHPYQVTKYRTVIKFYPVTKTKSESYYLVTESTIRSIVERHCRNQIDLVYNDLCLAAQNSFSELQNQLHDAGVVPIQEFIDFLKEDRKRIQRNQSNNTQDAQKITALLEELKTIRNTLLEVGKVEFKKPINNNNHNIHNQQLNTTESEIISSLLKMLSPKKSIQPNIDHRRNRDNHNQSQRFDWKCLISLLDELKILFGEHKLNLEELEILISKLKTCDVSICIAGLTKAGKSTLINSLMGCAVLPNDILPQTAQVIQIEDCSNMKYSQLTELTIPSLFIENQSSLPISSGLDEVSTYLKKEDDKQRSSSKNDVYREQLVVVGNLVWLRNFWKSGPFQLMDTPGYNEALLKTRVSSELRRALDVSEILIYALDSTRMFQNDDHELIGHLHPWLYKAVTGYFRNAESVDYSKIGQLPIIIVINKMDEWKKRCTKEPLNIFRSKVYQWVIKQLEEVLPKGFTPEDLYRILPFDRVVCVSGRSGLLSSVIKQGTVTEQQMLIALSTRYGDSWPSLIPAFELVQDSLSSKLEEESNMGELYQVINKAIENSLLSQLVLEAFSTARSIIKNLGGVVDSSSVDTIFALNSKLHQLEGVFRRNN
eukprot:TRINITY_DN4995_c0_g1_i2.p1 TRINITY_DN4995_c0_g1~~TRINITY_DN4995_c0_g1_i2.p1  ORF type:complete len:1236 (-),score=202.26 TRINITY_DN4995_c0_g1_i2:57-3764(-)